MPVAPADRSLILREQGLHNGLDQGCDRGPEEAADARGQLERSHVLRTFGAGALGDPDKEVQALPKDPSQLPRSACRRAHALGKELCRPIDAIVEHLVWLAIVPGGWNEDYLQDSETYVKVTGGF